MIVSEFEYPKTVEGTGEVPEGSGRAVDRLTRWFEDTFDCVEGEPTYKTFHPALTDEERHLFKFLYDLDGKNSLSIAQFEKYSDFLNRPSIAYSVLGATMPGGPENEELLCGHIRNQVIDLIAETIKTKGPIYGGRLYWRRKPAFRFRPTFTESKGKTFAFSGKTYFPLPDHCELTVRLAIPSLDLSKISKQDSGMLPVVSVSKAACEK